MSAPLAFVKSVALLKDFDTEILECLATLLVPHQVEDQEIVIEEGQAGHSLFFIADGVFEINKRGKPAPINQLKRGDYFGELGVLFHEPRSASVRAIGPGQIYELSAEIFRELFEAHQEIMDEVKKEARKRKYFLNPQQIRTNANTISRMKAKILAQKLASLDLFREIEMDILIDLALKLNKEMTRKNQIIFSQNDPAKAMYILAKGSVQVIDEEQQSALKTLSAGDIFGEMALIQESRRNATLQTLDFCELYRLDKADFKAVIDTHPEIASKIYQVAKQRSTDS